MKILAIDTATEACSAALLIDGEMTARYKIAPREHSRLILGMIDDLLLEANLAISEIDVIAFGRGPGSFMGLRIAAGVVQGIAFAHDIPVIPVSTLKAIAQRAYEETNTTCILVAIDARMDEVYWAAYKLENDSWLLNEDEQVVSPDKLNLTGIIEEGETWVAAGTGWGNYKARLLQTGLLKTELMQSSSQISTFLPDCLPSAEVIAKLAVKEFKAGNSVSAAEAIPVYLRNDVAKKPKPFVL